MWLIDTSHLIALFSTKDHFHLRAQALQQRIEQERIPLLITE
jgi:predicted nucleic acid-binding protein